VNRSIADQSTAELGGPGSVLVRQRRDHAELDRLLQRCRTSTGAQQQEALRQTWRLVFPHAFAEEAVLWPALRKAARTGRP
jgi:hemerythrin superfamily protein